MAQRLDDDMTISAAETVARANQMADVLDVATASFRGREPEAYAILSHAYAMPRLERETDRHRFGAEILTFTNKTLPYSEPENGEFFRAIQGLVVTMQEFPTWYHELKDGNEDLVEEYVAIWWVQKGMSVSLGLGTFSLSPGNIIGDARKAVFATPDVGASATVSGRLGRGAAAAGSSFGKVFTGGYAARASILGFFVGTVVYTALDDDRTRIGKEITRRYQERQLPADLYQRAFGPGTPLPTRYVFKAP